MCRPQSVWLDRKSGYAGDVLILPLTPYSTQIDDRGPRSQMSHSFTPKPQALDAFASSPWFVDDPPRWKTCIQPSHQHPLVEDRTYGHGGSGMLLLWLLHPFQLSSLPDCVDPCQM